MTSLSPAQFGTLFHGSGRDIAVGSHVLPNDRLGHGSDSRSGSVAYATPDEDTAWSFAAWNNPDRRTRVYEVAPGHDARRANSDSSVPDHGSLSDGEVVASKFKVAKQHDIMPGRQGTFPGIDWSRHSTVSEGLRHEVNHPENDDPSLQPGRPLLNVRTMAGRQAERTHQKSLKGRWR